MKSITRQWIYSYEGLKGLEENRKAQFILVGKWADGHYAYSMVDEDGNEIYGEESAYYQLKVNGHLIMVRC